MADLHPRDHSTDENLARLTNTLIDYKVIEYKATEYQAINYEAINYEVYSRGLQPLKDTRQSNDSLATERDS